MNLSKEIELTRHGREIVVTIEADATCHHGRIRLSEVQTSCKLTAEEQESAEESLREVARCYHELPEEEMADARAR